MEKKIYLMIEMFEKAVRKDELKGSTHPIDAASLHAIYLEWKCRLIDEIKKAIDN